jgi:hypothetical protein
VVTPYTTQLEGLASMELKQILAITVAAFELIGGIFIALNIGARFFALVMVLFVMAATFYFHDFWNLTGADAKGQMIHALKNSGGESVAVSEDEIVAALKRLARLGLFMEPTSASVAAAFAKLAARGVIAERENTVLLISGTGIKTASTIAEMF